MKRIVSTALLTLTCAGMASSQGFVNVGYVGDGFAFSIGTPVYPAVVAPPAPAVMPAVIPLMPGYDNYGHYNKHMRKARKYARKAAKHYRKAVDRPAPVQSGAMIATPFGTIYLGTQTHYYDDDWDDDYEDYHEHMHKKHKKHHHHHD